MNYLIKDAEAVMGCDDRSNESVTDIRIEAGKITELGTGLSARPTGEIIDASNAVVYPGLINTHHHLDQSIMKGVSAGINQDLDHWLELVPYRYWMHITPELMYKAALIGLSELLRSGATTCANHHYLYYKNSSQELEDAVWQAANDLGIRLVLCRAGSLQVAHRGMAKAGIETETMDQMLERLENSITQYHQPSSNAMRRLVVAPTSIMHSCNKDQLKELASFARCHGLKMHSHLLEISYDEQLSRSKYGLSAIDYVESCEWLGNDVWFAHLVQATEYDIAQLSRTGTSVAHCPTSNCRLGSGIAPIVDMDNSGVLVTIGVDGSASAESGSMIQELNLSWLIHRSLHGSCATTLETCLKWGSQNASTMLGLDSIGSITVGKSADIVLYDLSHFRYHGMHRRDWAPLLAGEPVNVLTSIINGNIVIDKGRIIGLDEEKLFKDFKQDLYQLNKKI